MKHLVPHFIYEQFQRGVYGGHMVAASLFVDISGFTPLTERLSRMKRGRPTRSSIFLTCIEIAEGVRPTTSAALEKLPLSAMATSVFSRSRSNSGIRVGLWIVMALLSENLIAEVKVIRLIEPQACANVYLRRSGHFPNHQKETRHDGFCRV